ncbi:hypothetical protein VARIO8X_50216 [Burkholderiales bacterium 8X]|nr:hypothetical protein VARIO8X_50216 [Burkholderiales bacterium 8X]
MPWSRCRVRRPARGSTEKTSSPPAPTRPAARSCPGCAPTRSITSASTSTNCRSSRAFAATRSRWCRRDAASRMLLSTFRRRRVWLPSSGCPTVGRFRPGSTFGASADCIRWSPASTARSRWPTRCPANASWCGWTPAAVAASTGAAPRPPGLARTARPRTCRSTPANPPRRQAVEKANEAGRMEMAGLLRSGPLRHRGRCRLRRAGRGGLQRDHSHRQPGVRQLQPDPRGAALRHRVDPGHRHGHGRRLVDHHELRHQLERGHRQHRGGAPAHRAFGLAARLQPVRRCLLCNRLGQRHGQRQLLGGGDRAGHHRAAQLQRLRQAAGQPVREAGLVRQQHHGDRELLDPDRAARRSTPVARRVTPQTSGHPCPGSRW